MRAADNTSSYREITFFPVFVAPCRICVAMCTQLVTSSSFINMYGCCPPLHAPKCFDRNELQQGTTVEDLRAADVECLIVTGDNAECGYYVACCAGFLDPGVPVLLGEAIASDTTGELQDTRSAHRSPMLENPRQEVSWTRIGNERLHDPGPPLNTSELLGALASDIDEEEQGKINYALVLTGTAWDILRRDGSSRRGDRGDNALQRLLPHVKVAARFSPGQKEDIVRALAAQGRTVAMVGDGGNDCAALRAAHVGLALNGAEASMVSPFSSTQRSIGALMDLLLEGRCALATSFANYKFLILQGLTLATAGVRIRSAVAPFSLSRCSSFSRMLRHSHQLQQRTAISHNSCGAAVSPLSEPWNCTCTLPTDCGCILRLVAQLHGLLFHRRGHRRNAQLRHGAVQTSCSACTDQASLTCPEPHTHTHTHTHTHHTHTHTHTQQQHEQQRG